MQIQIITHCNSSAFMRTHTVWKGLYATSFNYPVRAFSVYFHGCFAHHNRLYYWSKHVYKCEAIGLCASAVVHEECKDVSTCASLPGMHREHFEEGKTHFSRLVSIFPSLLKRSNGFLPSPYKLMQFAKTTASCCRCWGAQHYDPGQCCSFFLKAPISIAYLHWSQGLLLQLENNWHVRLINPCSNSINLLNGVITWMNLPLCSNVRGKCCSREPKNMVWQGCPR